MNYGRYQILREVGRGAMGVVYEARDPNIDRIVALKVLRQDRIATEAFVKRFLKEAKVIGRLSHPRIVTIYDVGEDNGTIYIAMEFLEGVPLSDLTHEKQFDAEKVIELGTQIASTLEYAHQKGVIHRDVKPNNIVINTDGQIKITDFGIAHIEDPIATLQTQAGEIMGTPAYMSPEQVQGHPVDCRSDLFSLGIILYELTTGMRPFGGEGKGLATIFNEIMLTTPHEPCKESPTVPKELSRIIMKALEKEPDKRFQTGRELAVALQQCLKLKEEEVVTSKSPPGTTSTGLKFFFAAALTVTLACGGIYFLYQYKETPADRQQTIPALIKPATPPIQTEATPARPSPPPTGSAPAAPVPEPETAKPSLPPLTPAPAAVTLSPPAAKPAAVPQTTAPLLPPDQTDFTPTGPKQPVTPKKTVTKPVAPLAGTPAPKPLPKFAFLKVKSTPNGASVHINGILKGKTPVTIKLGLGDYQVRLSHTGYRDSEKMIKLEKMTEYPLVENLKPVK